jgi:DNA-binding LytR/AlgR family response regulator
MTKSRIRCLVVDDEKLARTLLENYIGKLPQLELVQQCKNAIEAITVLENERIDLIFLDIQMPELSGIELLHSLPEKPLIVFTTAYQQYALEGYQLDVVDYLLKPFRFERFVQAVNKVTRRLNVGAGQPLSEEKKATESQDRPFMLFRSSGTVHKVFLDEILYIEGMKEYVAIHLPGQRVVTLQSLKRLEEDLPQGQFVRIHKSYIVAVSKITATNSGHVFIEKAALPIGGSYLDAVQPYLF